MSEQMFTERDISRMQAVDRSGLKDIRDVCVDDGLPVKERIADFVNQIENPYCYRHGKYIVKIDFTDTDVSLEERLLSYIRLKADSPE